MKILYIAFACNPYIGSEAQCGWSWPANMRKYAEVSVVTRKENQTDIERYMNEKDIHNIKVFYHDIPDCINLYYKYGKMYMAYYLLWQKTLYKFVKKLHDKYHFDYIHHVTLGDFRSISSVWKLDSKFIFGPVGGAQLTPEALKVYAKTDYKTERKRSLINSIVTVMPNYKNALNHTYLVLAANLETKETIKKRMKNPERCILLTENGVNQTQIRDLSEKTENKRIVLLWSGRMVNRKGISFLIDVLAKVKTDKDFVLKLVGDGPEKEKWEVQSRKLKLEDKIEFVGKVPYTEMQRLYSNSDIFVFPSLRETTGTVLFEAMVNGLPVVTFNQNGAALLINDECGIKVNVDQPIEDIKMEFANKLKLLIEDFGLRKKMGRAAHKRIVNNYTWSEKCKKFYDELLG